MHYLIYLPGKRGANPRHLVDVGLGGLLGGGHGPEFAEISRGGPDDGGGLLVHWSDVTRPELFPAPLVQLDRQVWTPAKPDPRQPADSEAGRAGRFWMGRLRDFAVTPAALRRGDAIGGGPVTLCDGQEWQIPVARLLPHSFGLGPDGRPSRQVSPQYAEFYRQTEEYFRQIVALRQDPQAVIEGRLANAWHFACEALAFNYRLNSDLVDWLGLLDDARIVWTIGATFELQAWAETEREKKTAGPAIPGI